MIGNVDLDLLEKTYQNASIGITAINAVLDKAENQELNNELHKQLKDYQDLAAKSRNQLIQNGTKVKEQSLYVKAMMKGNVKMNTIMRPSDSSIAQMVIQGSAMGVTQMTKLIHAKPNADGVSKDIAKEFIEKEEKNIEVMKKYL
jgi:cell division septum initiation protein DivIVA